MQINPWLVPAEECKERPDGFYAVVKNVMRNARLRVLSLSAAVQACHAARHGHVLLHVPNHKDPAASLCCFLTSEPRNAQETPFRCWSV